MYFSTFLNAYAAILDIKKEDLMEPGIHFLMKTNKYKIKSKSTKNSLIKNYFLIYALISRCENLKMLSEYSLNDILNAQCNGTFL